MGKGRRFLKAAGAAGVAAASLSTMAAGVLFGKFVKRPKEYEDLGVTPLDDYKDMIEEGRQEGRQEEMANTERERQRADAAEIEVLRLREEIERLKK